jgi:hypothetical protein
MFPVKLSLTGRFDKAASRFFMRGRLLFMDRSEWF